VLIGKDNYCEHKIVCIQKLLNIISPNPSLERRGIEKREKEVSSL
jgi:hypothetical protein